MSDSKQTAKDNSFNNCKPFCTITEAIQATGLAGYYLRQGVRSGWIPHIRCGNKIMINMKLFSAMLDEISQKGGVVNG